MILFPITIYFFPSVFEVCVIYIHYLCFLSLNIIFLRVMPAVVCISSLLIFMSQVVFHRINITQFFHFPACEHLGSLLFFNN